MEEPRKNFSKSAARALDVMEYLARPGVPRRAADIAEALGIARSSADQLLKSMRSSGYLGVSAQGKLYFPTMRLAPFGRWMADLYPAVETWKAIERDVHEMTGEIVTLSTRSECYMQIMHAIRVTPEDPLLEVGTQIPVVGSALGAAAMMSSSPHEIKHIYDMACRRRATFKDVAVEAPFVDELAIFRERGYSRRQSRVRVCGTELAFRDYWSIAMRLPSIGEHDGAIIGIAGPVDRVRPREGELVKMMRRAIEDHVNDLH